MKKSKRSLRFNVRYFVFLILFFYIEAGAVVLQRKLKKPEYTEQSIAIVTNPEQTETWVHLMEPAKEGDKWEIRSASGNLIDAGELDDSCVEFSLNTLTLPSGTYQVSVSDSLNKFSTEFNISR